LFEMQKRNMLTLIIVFAVVTLDQITKYLVTQFIPLHTEVGFIPWFINLTHVENEGASFGMFSDSRWVFMLLSAVAIIGIIIFLLLNKKRHTLLTIGLAFILGGGIGNMIDRIFRYTVVDFFEFTFVEFAIFNVADMFITFGAIILGVYLIFYDRTFNASKKAGAAKTVERDSDDDDITHTPER